jgi:hypothetical protein
LFFEKARCGFAQIRLANRIAGPFELASHPAYPHAARAHARSRPYLYVLAMYLQLQSVFLGFAREHIWNTTKIYKRIFLGIYDKLSQAKSSLSFGAWTIPAYGLPLPA